MHFGIFCSVIDNYGDAGVTWRLARQLRDDFGQDVTLWIDDPYTLAAFAPEVHPEKEVQQCGKLTLRRWHRPRPTASDHESLERIDVALEAFGCGLGEPWLETLAGRRPPPCWIHLEHLTPEPWAEGIHGLPSPHPRLPLTAWFFVPGFTPRTGGLLRERLLLETRDRFQRDPEAIGRFLARLGHAESIDSRRITLFCYADAELGAFLDWLAHEPLTTTIFVPPGQPRQALARTGLELDAKILTPPGAPQVRFVPLPMLPQDDFDRLLWSSNFNWVRGEDSFVRAQWSARPFLWHPYRQERNAHLLKLDAFLDHYLADAPETLDDAISRLFRRSNRGEETPQDWDGLWQRCDLWQAHCYRWSQRLALQEDLCTRLLDFVARNAIK
ncbi:elongation factor P maturation arginine rhamnosyltransferase EarP [Tepidiphilus margaritifer]|uniref:elongation factor P maturation arginine rhamnosyltransferase EarP n=1 Tax=Tepidiphilus margaritifer TaxID=203471 RepID=UPI0003FFC05F|nr:elongation factor P maturation arginine rhamnosyltransferase EarP [Tepidiphilus margaritifer]